MDCHFTILTECDVCCRRPAAGGERAVRADCVRGWRVAWRQRGGGTATSAEAWVAAPARPRARSDHGLQHQPSLGQGPDGTPYPVLRQPVQRQGSERAQVLYSYHWTKSSRLTLVEQQFIHVHFETFNEWSEHRLTQNIRNQKYWFRLQLRNQCTLNRLNAKWVCAWPERRESGIYLGV